MPNWYQNLVVIKPHQPTAQAQTLLKTLYELSIEFQSNGFLNKIAPLVGEWTYESAVCTWGSQWDIDLDSRLTPNDLRLTFCSAKNPPISAFLLASKKWADIQICMYFLDIENGFGGEAHILNGNMALIHYSYDDFAQMRVSPEMRTFIKDNDSFGFFEADDELS